MAYKVSQYYLKTILYLTRPEGHVHGKVETGVCMSVIVCVCVYCSIGDNGNLSYNNYGFVC